MTDPLALKEEDLKLMLAAGVHIGTRNIDPNMHRYVWRRKRDGVHIINLGKTWQKLVLAARVIVAIENPEDVVAISSRQWSAICVQIRTTYWCELYWREIHAGYVLKSNSKEICGTSSPSCC